MGNKVKIKINTRDIVDILFSTFRLVSEEHMLPMHLATIAIPSLYRADWIDVVTTSIFTPFNSSLLEGEHD
jgi:hypothetical protein